MPEEYQIQAVMVKTDCDRETAIKAIEWAKNRVTVAIRRVVADMNQNLVCGSCGEPLNEKWEYCPYCGCKSSEGVK